MIDLKRLKQRLIVDERLRLSPYLCSAGKLTIGVGRNLDDVGITEEEAMYLLENDIGKSIAELRRNYPWFDGLDTVRQEVLINMHFNLGQTRLAGFRKFLAALARRDYATAAVEMMDSAWSKQVGDRAERLEKAMKLGSW